MKKYFAKATAQPEFACLKKTEKSRVRAKFSNIVDCYNLSKKYRFSFFLSKKQLLSSFLTENGLYRRLLLVRVSVFGKVSTI